MFAGPLLVNAVVVASVTATLALVPRALGYRLPQLPRPKRRFGPEAALAVVVALIYLNQLLFTVYIARVHGGDTSFIGRYLPPGWFATADRSPVLHRLAEHFPAPGLLAPSLLRVQAFLELPFVLLAFTTVLRWLDPGLYRRLARLPVIGLAAASYTAVFCTVEWELRNPYTVQDIALRLVSALVTPWLIAVQAGRDEDDGRQVSTAGLLLFAVSLWAFGHLVLVVYDTALLYNLGHLGGRLPGAVTALLVLVTARTAAARIRPRVAPGAAVQTFADGLRWALALFFVPALAVRYGVNFGNPLLAAGAGALTLLAAAPLLAIRQGGVPGRLLLRLGLAFPAGLAAAWASVHAVSDTFYEAALIRALAVFLLAAVAICVLTDAALTRPEQQAG